MEGGQEWQVEGYLDIEREYMRVYDENKTRAVTNQSYIGQLCIGQLAQK